MRKTLFGLGLLGLISLDIAKPALGTQVVVQQRYDLSNRFELSLTPVVSIVDKYTQHVGTALGAAYFFNDFIGIEIEGSYAFLAGDRKLLNEIIRTGLRTLEGDNQQSDADDVRRLPLTDLKFMPWWVSGGLVFQPLYGKLNFSAEFAVNFHLYLVAGAGLAQTYYHELEFPAPNTFQKIKVNSGIKPVFHFGGGIRFHLAQAWSFKLEIRDLFFHDQYNALTPGAAGVEEKKINDFVHTAFFRLGVSYAF